MQAVSNVLDADAARLGIDIVDVRIKRADFPDTISQAIFRRMQTEREREAKEQQELGKQQESGQATTLGNVPSRSRAVQSGEEAAPEPGELPVEEPPSGSEEPTSAEEPSSTEQLPPPIPLDEGTTTPEE